MTFEDLEDEFKSQLVGPLILDRVTNIVSGYLAKRDPRLYAQEAFHFRDALEDVVHEFFEKELLGTGSSNQLQYIFDNADSLSSFDRQVMRQARRFIARKRKRTIVGNLIHRSWRMAAERPKLNADEDQIWFDGAPELNPTSSELRLSASLAQSVPITYETGKEHRDPEKETRLPKVYTDENLNTVLRVVLQSLQKKARRSDMQKVFEFLSGAWNVRVLDQDEAENISSPNLSPEEEVFVNTKAEAIVAQWSEEDRMIYLYKSAGNSDVTLARALDVSEDTARSRKQRWWSSVESELAGLDSVIRNGIIERLTSLVTEVDHG